MLVELMTDIPNSTSVTALLSMLSDLMQDLGMNRILPLSAIVLVLILIANYVQPQEQGKKITPPSALLKNVRRIVAK